MGPPQGSQIINPKIESQNIDGKLAFEVMSRSAEDWSRDRMIGRLLSILRGQKGGEEF